MLLIASHLKPIWRFKASPPPSPLTLGNDGGINDFRRFKFQPVTLSSDNYGPGPRAEGQHDILLPLLIPSNPRISTLRWRENMLAVHYLQFNMNIAMLKSEDCTRHSCCGFHLAMNGCDDCDVGQTTHRTLHSSHSHKLLWLLTRASRDTSSSLSSNIMIILSSLAE